MGPGSKRCSPFNLTRTRQKVKRFYLTDLQQKVKKSRPFELVFIENNNLCRISTNDAPIIKKKSNSFNSRAMIKCSLFLLQFGWRVN